MLRMVQLLQAGRQAGMQQRQHQQPVAAVHVRLHVHGVPHCL
jgi:hypothetical protein